MTRYLVLLTAGCTVADAGSLSIQGGGGVGAGALDYAWHAEVECGGTLHADSDCFRDSSLAGTWEELDNATELTIAEGAYGIQLTSACADKCGVFKPTTVSGGTDYVVSVHLYWTALTWDASGPLISLALAEDTSAAPTTANFYAVAYYELTPKFFTRTYAAYNNIGAEVDATSNISALSSVWLRACVLDSAADTVQGLMSSDGRGWTTSSTSTFVAAGTDPPVDYGILVEDSVTVWADAFIVQETSDCYEPIGDWDD